MSDTPELMAAMRKHHDELRRISEEAGFYDLEEPTPEQLVEALNEVRREMQHERQAKVSEKDIQKGYNLGYADGLAHGKLEGADETEERILELLDGKIATIFSEGDWSRATSLQELRGLIKGKQNYNESVAVLTEGEQK